MDWSIIQDALLSLRIHLDSDLSAASSQDLSSIVEKIFVHPLSSVEFEDGSLYVVGDIPWYMRHSQSACREDSFHVRSISS